MSCLVLAGALLQASEPGDALRRSVPADTVAVVEIADPGALIEPLLAPAAGRRLRSLPIWPALQQQEGWRQLQAGLGLVQLQLGVDWQTALRRLTGGGMVLALGPGQRAALLIESTDPALLARAHEAALGIARDHAAKAGEPDRVRSETIGGLTWWSFDGREQHAVAGSRLLLASDPAMRDRLIETARGPREGSLVAAKPLQAARRRLGNPPALAWVDLERARRQPGWGAAGNDPGRGDNPLAVLLLDSWPERLREARWMALGLAVRPERQSVTLRLITDRREPAESAESSPAPAPTLLPDPRVPGQIAVLRLHRDLHRFYAAKDERFPERTSGLIFFENMMGIFFSGRNLTEEVMAAPAPEWNLVVAAQRFADDAPVPEPELPGFALVLRLKDPEGFGPVIEEAWQKALGLINFTRGQQAEPGMILDRPRHRGLPITVARFSTAGVPPESQRDIRFNFQPTLARPDGFAILSSSESLARRLVDALKDPARARPTENPGVRTRLQIRGRPLVALLRRNREVLVRANMVGEGHTRQEAELAIDSLLAAASQVEWVELIAAGEGQPLTARLTLKLTPPPAEPES